MSLRYDLAEMTDPREVLQHVCRALTEGGLVCLQLEEGDWSMALATSSSAAKRFLSLPETGPAALLVSGPQAAGDLLHPLPQPAVQLLEGGRGPLLLEVSDSTLDASLMAQFPEITRQLVHRHGRVSLVPPAGEVTRSIVSRLSAPLLVCPAESTSNGKNVYDVMLADSSADSSGEWSTVSIEGDRWQLTHSGLLSEQDLRQTMVQQIIFVCTGNTCRSPMAEAMFRRMLADRLGCAPGDLMNHGYAVASAGLAAMVGAPASPESVQICAQQGVDLRDHASQPLTLTLLEQADRLYTMTAGHREAILARHPECADHVEMLSRDGQDVSDPIGWGRAAYEQCFAEITENLQELVNELTGTESGDSIS